MSGSQNLLLGGSPQAVPVDPYFYSVTSLLHGDGTNGGQNNTFLDSSSNNFTITRNGNTTQGSFSPFSQTGWSNYFSSTGSYLSIADNTDFALSGDFTIETWIYLTSQTLYPRIFSFGTYNAANSFGLEINSDSGNTRRLYSWYNGTSYALSANDAIPLNAWTHIAVVRSGTTITCYVNGTSTGTITGASATIDRAQPFYIAQLHGFESSADAQYVGYISNFSMLKGTAKYTSNFTPSTTPLAVNATNQVLLTCAANRFVDSNTSTTAKTITVFGSSSVQPFSPFNPTTAYSTSAVGGSGYFDGSGDYLRLAYSSALQFTGNFTIEFWAYPLTQVSSYAGVFNNYSSWPSSTGVSIFCGHASAGSTKWAVALFSTFPAIQTSADYIKNAWSHIALVRNGTGSNNITLYVNGVASGTFTSNNTVTGTADYWWVGTTGDAVSTQNFTGYLTDFRAVGSAVYTANFTPPSAPLTAVSNTQLLLSNINGAIFDNAAVADYETVGNAQISTSVKKYGTGSMYFDGTGDGLYTPNNTQLTFGTGDFTIEFWVYRVGNSVIQGLFDERTAAASEVRPTIYITTGNLISFYTGGADRITASISQNTWLHIAVNRTAGVTKLYINGTSQGSYTDSNNYLAPTNGVRIGYLIDGYSLNGYIDDIRITKGVARYPYNFTPPTAEFPNIGGTVTLTADPYFEYTTLLLPGNGTNGAQNNTFLDSSTNAFSITRNGNTTQGTFSPFSQTGWGNFFDGTGDYLSFADNAAFNMGTGNFTAEFWLYTADQTNNYPGIISASVYSDTGAISVRYDNTGHAKKIFIYLAGASPSDPLVTSSAYEFGQWIHVAIVRDSTTALKIYVNGTLDGTGTITSGQVVDFSGANSFYIGRGFDVDGAAGYLAGYVSNVRLVKGTAVYTSNFTPSTTPLTAITNTSLLTCQSNRFIDNSTNNFTITRNGDVSVQAFSPFNPTAAWSAATYGGSGYFDGSGDSLSLADNAAWNMGSGDFTAEAWIYPTSFANEAMIMGQWSGDLGGSGLNWALMLSSGSTGYLRLITSSNGSSVLFDLSTSTFALSLNAWQHIAAVRSGNTYTIYVNGVSRATTTNASALFDATNAFTIGSESNTPNQYFTGYISDARVVKGTAVYTAAFTPPTAPLTAISGTSLLANFTNAGITDATSKNDLETVGNAQISTTQSKFGGSSMYFDGTGDYLVCNAATNNLYAFGTGDFTLEMWVYFNSVASGSLFEFRPASTNGAYPLIYFSSSGVLTYYANSNPQINSSSVSTGQWYHIALCRYGTATKMYLNGIQTGSTYTDSSNYLCRANGPLIGVTSGLSSDFLNGYVDDFRITKGIARYTSNFTPPTTAFLTQ